jgi:hypothetical protein
MPANAGIQSSLDGLDELFLDPGLRRGDEREARSGV